MKRVIKEKPVPELKFSTKPILAFAAILCGAVISVSQTKIAAPNSEFRSPFRYVIVQNVVDRDDKSRKEDRRIVDVLIEKSAFSPDGLLQMYHLVRRRFQNPGLLYINVYTDLNDIPTPEERDRPVISERRDSKKDFGDYAIFVADRHRGQFYMYFANGDFREVQLK